MFKNFAGRKIKPMTQKNKLVKSQEAWYNHVMEAALGDFKEEKDVEKHITELFSTFSLGFATVQLNHITALWQITGGLSWCRTASAYDALVRSLMGAGVPKLLILCILMVWIWNTELPITPKWDALDLFSGTGSVKARCK
ncbi:unnamed protein product [Symbiodinium sp. KB8]|nr:unnamed protein product [Symbiodinium sp. KB8]